jgi:lysophospholipase L1-like esterase
MSAKSLTVVCLGDSITGNANLSAYLKFSHIVELLIEARRGYGSVVVHNRGIGGDCTEGVLARLDADALALKPDIVVLLIGGNDAGSVLHIPRATTEKNLDTIVGRLHTAGARVLMLQYHVLINPQKPEAMWAHLDHNNDLIASVAAKRKAALLDMAGPIKAGLARQPLSELVNPEDGVHLSPGGEIIYAREIFRKLVDLGWLD